MRGAEMQPASTILPFRIYHAADVREAPVNFLIAIWVVAERRYAVAHVAPVFPLANCPAHSCLVSCSLMIARCI